MTVMERQGSGDREQSGDWKEIDIFDLRESSVNSQGRSGDRDQAEPHEMTLQQARQGGNGAGSPSVSVEAEA